MYERIGAKSRREPMALGPSVRDVMTRDVYAVAPDTDLDTVSALFLIRHISGVPVVDEAGRPLGIVTRTELLGSRPQTRGSHGRPFYYVIRDGTIHAPRGPGHGSRQGEGAARDVMSSFVFTIPPDSPVLDAMRLMTGRELHRVVVADRGRIVGIVTSMDLLRAAVRWMDAENLPYDFAIGDGD